MEHYQTAIRYASNLMKDYSAVYGPRDLIHDCYAKYKEKTGNNIYEQDLSLVYRVVKNAYYNFLEKGYYIKNGEKHKKQILTVDDGSNIQGEVKGENTSNMYAPEEIKNPETILIGKDIVENLNNKLCEYDKKVLDLKLEGKTTKEIVKTLRTSKDRLAKSVRKIKEEMHSLSPFNGCKVTVVKRVKRRKSSKQPIFRCKRNGRSWITRGTSICKHD